MLIIQPFIFTQFDEITFGFSTKIGCKRKAPYYFNMSYNVGDDKDSVNENRSEFLKKIEIEDENVVFQKQVHADKITPASVGGDCGESDALITAEKNLALSISTADCPAIFIYDKKEKVIAAVHSGWRGTNKKILDKTLLQLKNQFGSNSQNLFCYISPSITAKNYRVGSEVAKLFDKKYVILQNDKPHIDLVSANYDMLLGFGVKESNIQVSNLCTYEYSSILHSYRRDGEYSGRALGIIAIKERSN